MASLELGKLSSYELLLSENSKDIYYVKLTDSLYKTLEEYHHHKNKGQIKLSVNKQGRGGVIQVIKEQNTSNYTFKCSTISNKTGLDCLKQTRSNPGLTVIGTAHTRLIIQATEDVYQTTREKLILAEEKNNENQTVVFEYKNKRKSQLALNKKSTEISAAPAAKTTASNVPAKAAQRTVPTFKSSHTTIVDSKAQQKLREKAIHILALRPRKKLELHPMLSDNNKSKDAITKILAQVSSTQNNMFHLKSFLYGEVQVEKWPDYTPSDRAAVRQQMQLHGHGTQSDGGESVVPPPPQPASKPDKLQSQPKTDKETKSQQKAESKRENKADKTESSSKTESKAEQSRKRSSSDDNKAAKKVCREKERVADEKGININVKCRKAAEDLKLPFMENVKKEIARIQYEYVTIMTDEQKMAYSSEFEHDYEEYTKLRRREKEIGAQFDVLKTNYDKVKADKRSAEVKSINRKARELFKQYTNDSNWRDDKERLLKLEAKLSHIKQLFKQYEVSNIS